MSDEPFSLKLSTLLLASHKKVPRRIVWRNPEDNLYHVVERDLNKIGGWRYADLKGYRHSTSAYAKLGRMYQKDMLVK